ncbi:maleylpyruvate isomerase family mycothiol-dependent enzyme [Isoptericola hypogeus]|uniref:Maleylpyruvate isomerase family mycothiol-dependent enzyme n=1 Tax=Isoptericola hypogeus TaxID=300179 RepID=A0ABP4VX17_9MICO
MTLPHQDYLPLLARLQDDFLAGVGDAAPGALVPACGAWTVRELVLHLAGVHRWAAGMVRGERVSDVVDPAGRDLADVYADSARELRATLAATPPDASVRTLVGAGPASFWHRRQVHETLVHLHDLRAAALGSGPAVVAGRPIDVAPGVWADTVDEVVTTFQPRQVRLGRMAPLARPVRLEASDAGGSWVLGTPAGTATAATATAPARELALLLWRRLTPAEAGVRVDGDASALDDALAAAIVP